MKEREIEQKIKEGWIRLKIVIEVAGFPKEHIEKAIASIGEKLHTEKSSIVVEQTTHPARNVSENMFSTFIEVELLSESLTQLMGLLYEYMPSSIEIIEPEDPISDDPQAVTMVLNDLLAKLHKYNQMVHAIQAENAILKKQLQNK